MSGHTVCNMDSNFSQSGLLQLTVDQLYSVCSIHERSQQSTCQVCTQ